MAMRPTLLLAPCALLLLSCAHEPLPNSIGILPVSTPVSEGLAAGGIERFVDSLRQAPWTTLHHVCVAHNGRLVYEWHADSLGADTPHKLYSCSKTFVSLAVGYALAEGHLRLEDTVPSTDITLLDLLTMRSGLAVDWDLRHKCTNWRAAYLAQKRVATPGRRFGYDSLSTYVLCCQLEEAVGCGTLEYLEPRLLRPLGIEGATWERSPEGVCCGGWGLALNAEQLTAVGQTLLDGGRWQGLQLVPHDYVQRLYSTRVPTPLGEAYSLGIWHSDPYPALRMDGAKGQYCIIVPGRNLVVTIFQNMKGRHTKQILGWLFDCVKEQGAGKSKH